MPGKPELDAAIVALVVAANDEISKANDVITAASEIITEATNAISRLLQKIAIGSPDTQPEIDSLNAIKESLTKTTSSLSDTTNSLTSAIATLKVEGV